MTAWFENESFWRDSFDFLFAGDRLELADKQVDQVIRLSGIQSGDVLDLCCGPGRHSVPLAKKGFTATGVDRSAFLLDKARERTESAHVDVELVNEDMRAFVREGSYDLVINLGDSIGYFDDREDDRRVFENVRRSLRPGGCFIVQMMCAEWLARANSDVVLTAPDGALCLMRYKIVDDWTVQENE